MWQCEGLVLRDRQASVLSAATDITVGKMSFSVLGTINRLNL